MKSPTLLKISCTQHERSGYGKDDITVREYPETFVYYNEAGKAIKEEHFLPTGELDSILINDYDESGVLLSAKQFDNQDTLLQKTDFTYDDYQNIIRQDHYFGDESTKYSELFIYENGALVREDIYNGNEFIHTEKKYTYDEKSNLIQSIEYDEDGNEKVIITHEYNENNFVIKRVKDEIIEKDKRVYVYEYDENGNKAKDLIYDFSDILISKTYYNYNENKQLLEKEEEDLDRYLKTVNTFTEDQLVKSEILDKEGNLVTWTEFEYDENGLVTSQKYYTQDETDNTEYRVIVAYRYERIY